MPTAVISDIHANAAALRRVLQEIDARGVQRIVCLGDVVGYGPDPLECVDLVRERCAWSLMGNHDFGVLYEPTNFNPGAESSAFWTREQFDREPDDARRAARYDFMGKLRVRVVERVGENGPEPVASPNGVAMPEASPSFPLLAVHGSPRRPINEYVFPDDVVNARDKIEGLFDRVQHLAIVGHTHVPGVFTDEPEFYPPGELGESRYKFRPGEKAIINVGSVGQPRDFDPRASFAIIHADRVEFVRIAYDIDATAKKIQAIPQLPDWLAKRLYEGR